MDFEEQIRDSYKKKTADRGDCPSPDELIRYHQRELSTDELFSIKQHVNVCGSCDLTVVQLSEFDSATSSAVRDPEESKRKGFLVRLLFHPMLAYGIVLVLLYPAYQGLFKSDRTPKQAVGATGSAMDFDLGHASTTRSTPQKKEVVVTLLPAERFFILTFFVPVRSAYRYEMEIRNEHRMVVDSGVIRGRDSVGNFSIVAASSLFPDGRYDLAVQEIESETGTTRDEHYFQFRVTRNQ